jgi:acetamidase/formamidase
MTTYTISPDSTTLHGHFSPDLPAVLTIQPGDTVVFQTLDANWYAYEHADPFSIPPKVPHDRERDSGHAMCGPVAIAGAKPGMTLVVRLATIRTGPHGFSKAGGVPSITNQQLGLAEPPDWIVRWQLDPDRGMATSQYGQRLPMRPFIGNLGMPPAEPGWHSTIPPRFCGGNLDCKELVAGSTLYLPITVAGGLFSLGDGHAMQGDGEVSGLALECPMEQVAVTFDLRDNMPLQMLRAETPAGWICFGIHEDLNQATTFAISGMLDLLEQRGYQRKEAMMLASLVVDLHVTQIVNQVKGVHAILPHAALDTCPPARIS